MNSKIIQDRLDTYHAASVQEQEQALKEIAQELTLAGLSRTDFFKHAAFQGGTCLRILHSLERFSEDMDFVLTTAQPQFVWETYLKSIATEFMAYGIKIDINDRSSQKSTVQKAWIKSDSLGKILTVRFKAPIGKMHIKLETDTHPPLGSHYETRYLDFPFSCAILAQDLPSLFAGKNHALLCREYVKGRDWYDFLWYTRRKTTINFELLANALAQMGPWQGKKFSIDKIWYVKNLTKKIRAIDWDTTKKDVMRFLQPREWDGLNVWSRDFFLQRLQAYAETL